MRQQEPGFGPDMRHIAFRATRERQEAEDANRSDIDVDPETGEGRLSARGASRAMAILRVRWRWMAAVQAIVVAGGTGWVLFTQYAPGMPMATPTFMMCLLVIAGCAISMGVCGFATFDADSHDREEAVLLAANMQYMPIAGLLSWAVCMVLFWRYLHGWDPGRATFMIANPFGLIVVSWLAAFLTIALVVTPAVDIARSLKRGWRNRTPGA
ncbi:hypothetical protein [Pseudoxanthomonas sp. Root630]|uniref:hypothetical protein n=1 Tax=Pseudoxanthomonas sp. Root630 TaxID=1736574 RepID=UPI000702F916|nr:hypothetical protein [Pseudoxanthomonas sp. Root630]KRA40133.1 hypothetical protein ASD72_17050 [Pseudoxanthomonas sp. Root630]